MKTIPILLTALFFLLIGPAANAQAFGEIKGKLIDAGGQPVPFANAYVQAGDGLIGSTSDFDGKFTIKPLMPGTYNVYITHVQFDSLMLAEVKVDPDRITFVGTNTMSVNTLNVLTIIGQTEDLIIVDNPSLMTITSKDIENSIDGRDQAAMIARAIPGVKLSDDGRQLYFRGSRPQNVSTFIDGVKVLGSEIPSLPRNALSRVSVYTGGIPAKYGDVTGGVIILETKTYMDFWNERQAQKRRAESERTLGAN